MSLGALVFVELSGRVSGLATTVDETLTAAGGTFTVEGSGVASVTIIIECWLLSSESLLNSALSEPGSSSEL